MNESDVIMIARCQMRSVLSGVNIEKREKIRFVTRDFLSSHGMEVDSLYYYY